MLNEPIKNDATTSCSHFTPVHRRPQTLRENVRKTVFLETPITAEGNRRSVDAISDILAVWHQQVATGGSPVAMSFTDYDRSLCGIGPFKLHGL